MADKLDRKSYHEKELRSTPGDFDRFMNSKMWFDLRSTMEERIEFLREQLVNLPNTQEANYEMIAIKNQMRAFTEMMGLPSYLKAVAHKEQSKKDGE